MRFRNLKRWIDLPNQIGLIFFAQRMEELLFDYSLDTYKPPALNSIYLCEEALKLILDIEANLIDSSNLETVLEELKWSISRDKVAKSLIDTNIEKYILNTEKYKLAEVKIRLEVLHRNLNQMRYLTKVNELLLDAVDKGSKKDIDALSQTLATTLINIGLSKQFLYEKTIEHFFLGSEKIKDISHLDDYLENTISPTIHNFDLYYIVSDLINQVQNSSTVFGIEIISKLPRNVVALAKTTKFCKQKNEVYVHVKDIRAFDIYTAKEQAEKKLGELSDFFVLFHHKAKINWRENALVNQCCLGSPIVATQPKSSMEKCFDLKPEKASIELNWLLENFGMYGSESYSKFRRIVDLHGTCVASNLAENQLLNIWISIETFVPSHSGKSKIQGIVNSVTPLLMINYIERLVQRLSIDLFNWNKFKCAHILKKVPDGKDLEWSHRIFMLLAIDSNEALRNELYRALGDFHLLRFRIFTLTELLSTPQKIIDLMDNHEKKVAWQLRRLYRTRNILVHSSRNTPSYIHTLIENGHDYLDQLLWICMKLSCGSMETSTIEQAFEVGKLRHEHNHAKIKSLTKITSADLELFFPDWN